MIHVKRNRGAVELIPFLLLAFVTFCGCSVAPSSTDPSLDFSRMISQLGADDHVQRERAEQELLALDRIALSPLLDAIGSTADPELRARASRVAMETLRRRAGQMFPMSLDGQTFSAVDSQGEKHSLEFHVTMCNELLQESASRKLVEIEVRHNCQMRLVETYSTLCLQEEGTFQPLLCDYFRVDDPGSLEIRTTFALVGACSRRKSEESSGPAATGPGAGEWSMWYPGSYTLELLVPLNAYLTCYLRGIDQCDWTVCINGNGNHPGRGRTADICVKAKTLEEWRAEINIGDAKSEEVRISPQSGRLVEFRFLDLVWKQE